MFIKELPVDERPREKMMAYGVDFLSNAELLAILLRTGTKEKSAVHLAEEVLSLEKMGILYLAECAPEELASIKGIGMAKACQILAAIALGKRVATKPRQKKELVNNPQALAALFMEDLRYCNKESFNLVLINTKGEVIGIERTFVGDLSSTIIHPREVFRTAVKRSAAALAFVHNHPSGDPTPSPDDIATTKRLVEVGKIIGIGVWDHLVIGDGNYISFREQQLI